MDAHFGPANNSRERAYNYCYIEYDAKWMFYTTSVNLPWRAFIDCLIFCEVHSFYPIA